MTALSPAWALSALERHETHRIRMPRIGPVLQPLELAPAGNIPWREIHIPGDVAVHARQIKPRRYRQRLLIHRCAADNAWRRSAGYQRASRLDARPGLDALGKREPPAGQHEIATPRQRLADRFEGAPSHEHRLAERDGLEMLQIVGKMPGQRAAAANDTIVRHSNNQRDACGHEPLRARPASPARSRAARAYERTRPPAYCFAASRQTGGGARPRSRLEPAARPDASRERTSSPARTVSAHARGTA